MRLSIMKLAPTFSQSQIRDDKQIQGYLLKPNKNDRIIIQDDKVGEY